MTNDFKISYTGAKSVAPQYPQCTDQIIAAAKTAFLTGDQSAYLAGIIAILVGVALFIIPKKEKEHKLLWEYHAADVQ